LHPVELANGEAGNDPEKTQFFSLNLYVLLNVLPRRPISTVFPEKMHESIVIPFPRLELARVPPSFELL
jgi:hypothetical protein